MGIVVSDTAGDRRGSKRKRSQRGRSVADRGNRWRVQFPDLFDLHSAELEELEWSDNDNTTSRTCSGKTETLRPQSGDPDDTEDSKSAGSPPGGNASVEAPARANVPLPDPLVQTEVKRPTGKKPPVRAYHLSGSGRHRTTSC